MGTSKSFPTPSGGNWTPIKREITQSVNGGDNSPIPIISGVITASGGLTRVSTGKEGTSRAGGSGSAGGGGTGGHSQSGGGFTSAVGGLGGFASTLATSSLDSALKFLDLEELKGKPALEVIASIAEHLSEGADGLEREILTSAIRDAIFEAAELGNEVGYEDLEKGLQDFLSNEGIEGLIEIFLARYVFEFVWSKIEQHAQSNSPNDNALEAMQTAFINACKSEIRTVIAAEKSKGRFKNLDWFGKDGAKIGKELAASIESHLAGQQ